MGRRVFNLISVLLVVLILGTSNHCALEDILVSLNRDVLGSNAPEHLDHHAGSAADHHHDNSGESHQHGETHPLSYLSMDKVRFELSNFAAISFLIPFPAADNDHLLSNAPMDCSDYFRSGDPPGRCGWHISTLTSAPLAPPTLA